ncbi:MAG TPA: ELWxxDGT repeat protein [Chitinophagaceae bacterium]
MRKFFCLIVTLLIVCIDINAQTFTLVKDINPGTTPAFPSQGTSFVAVNNVLYFRANDGINGIELWKSDGTTAGTVMVKNIMPGGGSSRPDWLTNVNGTLFFQADDGVHGPELWKSDGTEAGTVLVKDLLPGINGDTPPQFLASMNGILYFQANDGPSGKELWKSDGTTEGTVMVVDLRPGNGLGAGAQYITVVNGMLFFNSFGGLWKSDGTAAGTVYLGAGIDPYAFGNVNGTLFFSTNPTNVNRDLWKSNGTAAGTVLVKDICPGPCGSRPSGFTGIGSTIFFKAAPEDVFLSEPKPFITDGTGPGTSLLKDIYIGLGSVAIGNTVYFNQSGGGIYGKLWKTDGTTPNTVMVKDVSARIGSAMAIAMNNNLLFAASDGAHGAELWRSNGTEAGTFLLQEFVPGTGSSDPTDLVILNNKIFLTAHTSEYGRELWVTDIPGEGALPLTLLDFKAQLSGNNGLLNWVTSSEQNTSHFEIERSLDGRNFTKTGTIAASGNSSAEKQYGYTDRNITSLNAPIVYYRLKMKDIDSKFTYSKTIAINISSSETVVMLYPNPVIESATLMIAARKKESISYSIVDMSGRTLQQKNISINEGSNLLTIETNSLAAGVYTIILNGNETNSRVKFVKQ